MTPAKKSKKTTNTLGIDFSKRNYMVLGIGLAVILLGFILLALGDITISPILLVLGYCVIIPLGILLPKEKAEVSQAGPKSDGVQAGQNIQGS
jgi:hypothetical protein